MRELLNTISLRQLEFIELLFYADDWVTSEQIAEQLQCSVRILRDDISVINKNFDPFHIDTSNKNGILLEYPKNYSIDYIYTVVLSNSYEFRFLDIIFHDETLFIEQICERLYISPSTLSRIVKKMKKYFSNLGIELKTGPFCLQGDERAIRVLYYQFFMEKSLTGCFPMCLEKKQAIDSLLLLAGKKGYLSLNYPDLKQIRLMTYVGMVRISNGNSRKNLNIQVKSRHTFKSIISNQKLQNLFMKSFESSLTKEIIDDVFAIFVKDDYAINLDHLAKLSEGNNQKIVTIIQNISKFLDGLSKRLGIPIKNKQQILLELYNIQQLFGGSTYVLFDKKKQFATFVRQEYPLLIEILEEELRGFRFDDTFSWKESSFNEIIYTLIIHWTNLPESFKTMIKPLKIGVFCDYDLEHSNFLIDMINFHFDRHVHVKNFDAITESEAYQESIKYDLVITNMSNCFLQATEVICINSVPTTHDWKDIKRSIKEFPTQKILTTKFISY